METVTLNNDVQMPILGFGVFQITGKECERCVLDAIDLGYRLIDTAQAYYNEEEVGHALQKCGVARNEIFLTTKVWVTEHSYEIAKKYGKSPTQIALRFNIQRGIVVIPKTVNKERMKENFEIFDFTMTAEEMNRIRTIDENKSMWAAYDNPEIVELAMEES